MNDEAYTTRVDDALALVASAFREKRRKGRTIPYLAHLLWVAGAVADHGGDEDLFVAALLHDYLEDIPGASEVEVRTRFGDRVADVVVACSDTVVRPKPPWSERKGLFLRRIPTMDAGARLVLGCDKLHNGLSLLRDLEAEGPATLERFNAPAVATLWYFRRVAFHLGQGWEHPVHRELDAVVSDLHAVAGHVRPEEEEDSDDPPV